MLDTIVTQSIVIAAGGGFIFNLVSLLELKNIPKGERPDLKDLLYWLPLFCWPFIGSFLAFVYEDGAHPLSRLVAFHIGLSAPLIIRSMASIVPQSVRQELPPGA